MTSESNDNQSDDPSVDKELPDGSAPSQVGEPKKDESTDESRGQEQDIAISLIEKMPSLARVTSVIMLVAGILIVGLLFYKVMVGFFIPLFMAAALVVIFRPIDEWFLKKFGGRRKLAAIATTSLILSIVLLPIALLIFIAIGQLTGLVSRTDLDDLKSALERGRMRLGLDLEHADLFRRLDALAGKLDQVNEPDLVRSQIIESKELIEYLDKDVAGNAPTEETRDTALERLSELTVIVDQLVEARERAEAQTESEENDEAPTSRDDSSLELADRDSIASADEADTSPSESESSLPSGTSEEPMSDSVASVDDETTVEESSASEVPAVVDAIVADESAARVVIEERFHRNSVVASAAIHTWMNSKLGGSFRTQAKLLTNPSEKDLASAVRAAREYLQPRFVKFSGVTGKAVIQMVIGMLIMVISVYFFFVDGPAMIRTLMRLSPLDDAYELRLLGEFEKTSRAVVLASVLSALVQGFLAAIAFFICGFESFILLFMVTTVMSLIPFLGAASVWVPCAIYLAAVDQSWGAAIFLAIYGAAVVSSIDNVIKAFVLHGHSELHPLVALLSVLGGVPVFGPIGILIGPMVVVFLQTLLEILNHELERRDEATVKETRLDNGELGVEVTVSH